MQPKRKKFGAAKQTFHFLAYMIDQCCVDEWIASMDPVHKNSAEEWLVKRDPNFISILCKLTLKGQEMFLNGMCSSSLQMSFTHLIDVSCEREVNSSLSQ